MLRFLPALSLLLLALPAHAEELTVYRCTDADGHVAWRYSPCTGSVKSSRLSAGRNRCMATVCARAG